jgi:hypothetical protein
VRFDRQLRGIGNAVAAARADLAIAIGQHGLAGHQSVLVRAPEHLVALAVRDVDCARLVDLDHARLARIEGSVVLGHHPVHAHHARDLGAIAHAAGHDRIRIDAPNRLRHLRGRGRRQDRRPGDQFRRIRHHAFLDRLAHQHDGSRTAGNAQHHGDGHAFLEALGLLALTNIGRAREHDRNE